MNAPKSNTAYLVIDRVIADPRHGKGAAVPMHLRSSHCSGAKRIEHGRGYIYAHDTPHHVIAQQYLPEDLRGVHYYEPTQIEHEALTTKRLAALRGLLTTR